MLIVGMLLPVIATSYYAPSGTTFYVAPYLWLGIALAYVGIVLIIVNPILQRRHRLRKAAQPESQTEPRDQSS